MKVLEMRVGWMIGWGNMPSLHALIDDPPPKDLDRTYRLFPQNRGMFLISRVEPDVRFTWEDTEYGGGACGGKFAIEHGGFYQSNGGWSSNVGRINQLRTEQEPVAEYLPFPLVDITIYGDYRGQYNDGWGMGMAGHSFDLPWVEKQIEEFLPGVDLLDVNDYSKPADDASSDQSMIISGGVSGYGFLPVPAGLTEVTRQTVKPDIDSELFLRTAMQWDRKQADQIRAKAKS